MNLGGNILLWVSMVWLPVLLCALMVRDGKPRKNMVVGVTLPYSLPAVPACLIRSFGVSMTVWLVWILVVCVVFLMPYARCNAALRRLKAQRVGEKPGDEDRHWLWGMFYWNPQDPRLLVSARLGVGTTINLARRWGQAVAGLLALLLLGCPLVGVWIMGMERAPVELTVAEEAVVGHRPALRPDGKVFQRGLGPLHLLHRPPGGAVAPAAGAGWGYLPLRRQ